MWSSRRVHIYLDAEVFCKIEKENNDQVRISSFSLRKKKEKKLLAVITVTSGLDTQTRLISHCNDPLASFPCSCKQKKFGLRAQL